MPKKKTRLRSKTDAKRSAAHIRQGEVYLLRCSGYSYPAIAKKLGYNSRQAAFDAYKTWFEKYKDQIIEEGSKHRVMSMERIFVALKAIMPKVRRGNLGAIDRLDKMEGRIARLMGIEAPTKTEVTGADGGPVETVDKTRDIEKELQKPERLKAVLEVADRHDMLKYLLGYMGENGPPSKTEREGTEEPRRGDAAGSKAHT